MPFGLGPMELGIIALIALLFFGPSQLPKMGKAVGDTIREMKKAGKELRGDDDKD